MLSPTSLDAVIVRPVYGVSSTVSAMISLSMSLMQLVSRRKRRRCRSGLSRIRSWGFRICAMPCATTMREHPLHSTRTSAAVSMRCLIVRRPCRIRLTMWSISTNVRSRHNRQPGVLSLRCVQNYLVRWVPASGLAMTMETWLPIRRCIVV